jgi:hypothetical protein
MNNPKHFFVCLYSKKGRRVDHSISLEPDFAPNFDDQMSDPKATTSESEQISGFANRFNDFVQSTFGFIEFVPLILAFTPAFSEMMLEGFDEFLKQKSLRGCFETRS